MATEKKIAELLAQAQRELADKIAALLTTPSDDARKPAPKRVGRPKKNVAPKATPKKRGRPKGSKNKSAAQTAATLAGAPPVEASS